MSCNSRANRISIQWVNHNGWIDIFVIKKKLLLCSYFWHISLCFYSNFDRESSLDVKLNYTSNEYPHYILLMDSSTPKTRNTLKTWWWDQHHIFSGILLPQKQEIPEKTWWWHHHHIFSCIYYFWGRGVRQKYVVWVLVRYRIKFGIQWDLRLKFE